jgi:hypothetical protein
VPTDAPQRSQRVARSAIAARNEPPHRSLPTHALAAKPGSARRQRRSPRPPAMHRSAARGLLRRGWSGGRAGVPRGRLPPPDRSPASGTRRRMPPAQAHHRLHTQRIAPHRTAPHRTAPHRTAPHRIASHAGNGVRMGLPACTVCARLRTGAATSPRPAEECSSELPLRAGRVVRARRRPEGTPLRDWRRFTGLQRGPVDAM